MVIFLDEKCRFCRIRWSFYKMIWPGINIEIYYMSWSIRPNPEGWIIRKPEGQISDEMVEQLENWKAEFDHKAKYIALVIPTQYILGR